MKTTTFIQELRSYAETRGLSSVEEALQNAGQLLHTNGVTAIKYLYLSHAIGEDNLEEMSVSDLVDVYEVSINNWLYHNGSPDSIYTILDELSGRGWPF